MKTVKDGIVIVDMEDGSTAPFTSVMYEQEVAILEERKLQVGPLLCDTEATFLTSAKQILNDPYINAAMHRLSKK